MTDDSSRPRYQTAGAVLDGLREQLKETPQDEMKLLLKILKDLKTLDTDKMSPRDASLWMFQEVTKQEARVTNIATQAGFNRGFTVGLFSGFILCVFIWTVFISHRS